MTDNVIWGTDFRASKLDAISTERLGPEFEKVLYDNLQDLYLADTTPSDYTAPTDDCA